MLELSYHI